MCLSRAQAWPATKQLPPFWQVDGGTEGPIGPGSALSDDIMHMLLLKNIDLYAPARSGRTDLLIGGGRIIHVAADIAPPGDYCEVVDAGGLVATPGFIDAHVHITGGGGEGGFATRTPELVLSDAIRGGVTTIVGCLGTDGITRSQAALLAKARGLDEEGITTFMWTGHYAVPVTTLTGSIERDLILIDKVIGVGEIAISDHRSTQPTFDEFARMAAEARRGGILSGKAGVLHTHLGDGRRALELLRRVVAETEIPRTQFLPTHVNRNAWLFDEGIAWAKAGGFVDFTTSTVQAFLDDGEVKCSDGAAPDARSRRGRDAHHLHVGWAGQPARVRREGRADAPRSGPRDEPDRRGA